jgi:dTDP-4-dehydrorhamnose reductase
MAPRWLVTGAAGFLGSNVGIFLNGRAHRTGLSRDPQASPFYDAHLNVDLRDHVALSKAIRSERPQVILHAAAYSGHVTCANDPEMAWAVNVESTRVISELAAEIGARLIFISTDAVFSGYQGNYLENDPVEPFSFYGETKVAGEKLVTSISPESLVIRTNFFGWSAPGNVSVLEFFLNSLRLGREVPGFRDSTVTSIYVTSLIDGIWRLSNSSVNGVVHLASSNALSKYQFGVSVAQEFGLDPRLIIAEETTDRSAISPRNRNISLSTELVSNLLGEKMPTQAEGISFAHNQEQDLRAAFFSTT